MADAREDVYATLLMNDTYLPGALVLAHSLKDAGTTKRLAVLVTTDTVSADAMVELQKVYDFIVPVARLRNETPANLYLMDRTDLHSAFTKIELWKQEQFRKIVYMDADMVALRAPDELFQLAAPFSAAPDIGWPDLFNSGLMVLSPNMGDYYALLAMAQRGISFDGADQGLLNMHFKHTYNRLSFTYNVTPSPHYQYFPAYKHFQSSISAAHFIGKDKPWTQGRDASMGGGAYSDLIGRWWAVYDRHFRAFSSYSGQGHVPWIVQYYTKGEFQPSESTFGYSSAPAAPQQTEREIPSEDTPRSAAEEPMHQTSEVIATMQDTESHAVQAPQEPFQPTMSAWDAARAPPPADSKPEAANFQGAHYEMSKDKSQFKAPTKYPEPPKNMWYEVPQTPTYQKPAPIFPWEKHASKPSRVFAEDLEAERRASITTTTESSGPTKTSQPVTPTISFTSADPWQDYNNNRGNAWDDIPEIEQYIGKLQKNRKGNIQVLQGYGSGIAQVTSPDGKRSMKLTDFPTELERPSLPVTPAPIRRPTFWGEERNEDGALPAAEGVPSQEDWNPSAQLDMLARRQSDVLANKLGNLESLKELPSRALPYGSEGVVSPTYVAPVPPSSGEAAASMDKDQNLQTQANALPPSEAEKDALS